MISLTEQITSDYFNYMTFCEHYIHTDMNLLTEAEIIAVLQEAQKSKVKLRTKIKTEARKRIDQIRKAFREQIAKMKKGGATKQRIAAATEEFEERIKKVYNWTKEQLKKIDEKARDLAQKAKSRVKTVNYKKAGKRALAVTAVVAAVIAAGRIAYKKKNKEALAACSGKKGLEKDMCLQQFRRRAVRERINELRGGLNKCSQSADPQKCRQSILKEIKKQENKL